jgi:hypothetical protein
MAASQLHTRWPVWPRDIGPEVIGSGAEVL